MVAARTSVLRTSYRKGLRGGEETRRGSIEKTIVESTRVIARIGRIAANDVRAPGTVVLEVSSGARAQNDGNQGCRALEDGSFGW